MSLEQKVRDSLATQVADPPVARDLATRSLHGARAVRRRRTAVAVAAVAIAAVAVPLALQPSRTKQSPVAPPSVTSSPTTSASALPFGAEPKWGAILDNRLHRASGPSVPVELPGQIIDAVSTPLETVILAATGSTSRLYIVRNDGSINDLVTKPGPILSIAVDATRVAYAVQVVNGRNVTSNLFLIDLASGNLLQRLDGAPNASPVGFGPESVVLGVGDGAESSSGSWRLGSNTLVGWPESLSDVPLHAVGNVALVAEEDASCVAVVELEPFKHRFTRCPGGAPYSDRFGVLAPGGKRYAGSRYSQPEVVTGLAGPLQTKAWPVVGNAATGLTNDGLRSVFRKSELRVDPSGRTQMVWEDDSRILVNVLDRYGAQQIVRCDVDAATCEIAFIAAISSQSEPQLVLVRGV